MILPVLPPGPPADLPSGEALVAFLRGQPLAPDAPTLFDVTADLSPEALAFGQREAAFAFVRTLLEGVDDEIMVAETGSTLPPDAPTRLDLGDEAARLELLFQEDDTEPAPSAIAKLFDDEYAGAKASAIRDMRMRGVPEDAAKAIAEGLYAPLPGDEYDDDDEDL